LLFFVTGLLLAAITGAELFGIISLMIVNAATFIIITDFGTGAALVWHRAGNEIQQERIFSFAAGSGLFQLLLFIFIELVVVKISGKTLLTRQPANTFYFLSDLLYFTGLIIIEKYTSLFYGCNKAALANKILSIATGCFLAIFILMYAKVITAINPLIFFCLMIFALGLSEAIGFHTTIDGGNFAMPANKELKSLLTFSAIVFITNIIQFFAYRLDFWIIDHFYTHTELGIYAQANRFAQLTWVLPGIIATLLTPAVRNNINPLDDKSFLMLDRALNFVTFFIGVGVIVIASFFYHWFFPPEYSKGLPALLFMLPGYFFFATTTLLAAWFSAKRLLKVNLIGSFICFIIILVADLILIPIYSLKGAGLANTIAYSITTLYFIMQFKKYTSVKMKDLFLWRKKDILVFKTFIS
jgi:O-antigen/teichoic acid export membrane protein